MIQDLSNIPGFQNTYNDYNLQAASTVTSSSSTASVLLIGTALDGPVGPYAVQRISDVDSLFGSQVDSNGMPNGKSLVRAAHENYAGGCTSIYLMRVGGSQATGSLSGTAISETLTTEIAETVGNIAGNAITVISLIIPTGGALVTESVVVTVGGESVGSGITVDGVGNTVTLASGSFSAGAAVYITYQYTIVTNSEVVVNEDALVDSATTFYVQHSNVETATLVVSVGGTVASSSRYTFTAASNKIVFSTAPTGTVTASYTYDIVSTASTFVNGVVAGSTNIFSLSEVPISGSMVVTVGSTVIDPSTYNVVTVDQKLFVNAGVGNMGDAVVADYDYLASGSIIPTLNITSKYSGSLYNTVTASIAYVGSLGTLTLTAPTSKGGASVSIVINKYASIAQLINAINASAASSFCTVSTNVASLAPTVLSAGYVQLSQGTDGPSDFDVTFKSQMYTLLDAAYTQLINFHADFVLPLDVYFGDPAPGNCDFVQQLAQFTAISSMVNRSTHGIISVAPVASVSSLADVANYVAGLSVPGVNLHYLQDDSGNNVFDANGNLIDIGRFISVVAGPDIIVQNTQLGIYGTPGAVLYAGYISTLPVNQGPVGQSIPNTYGLRYNLSLAQVNQLLKLQYVCFYTPANQAAPSPVVIADGLTAAGPTSDYRRLTTVRVVAGVVDVIMTTCKPFLGLPNSPQNQGAMTTAIKAQFTKLIAAGVLLTPSTFTIYASVQNALLSTALIDVSLYVPLELAHIQTTITLQPAV